MRRYFLDMDLDKFLHSNYSTDDTTLCCEGNVQPKRKMHKDSATKVLQGCSLQTKTLTQLLKSTGIVPETATSKY